MAEPLFGQVLAAVVSDLFLGTAKVLLVPVSADFEETEGLLGRK